MQRSNPTARRRMNALGDLVPRSTSRELRAAISAWLSTAFDRCQSPANSALLSFVPSTYLPIHLKAFRSSVLQPMNAGLFRLNPR